MQTYRSTILLAALVLAALALLGAAGTAFNPYPKVRYQVLVQQPNGAGLGGVQVVFSFPQAQDTVTTSSWGEALAWYQGSIGDLKITAAKPGWICLRPAGAPTPALPPSSSSSLSWPTTNKQPQPRLPIKGGQGGPP